MPKGCRAFQFHNTVSPCRFPPWKTRCIFAPDPDRPPTARNMPRIARVVLPGIPYHVTHRGNHRHVVFYSNADRLLYLSMLKKYSKRFEMRIWAYCLMENHVHLQVVGQSEDSMSRAVGITHCQYARYLNKRRGVTGHLWDNRFYSTALDDHHLWAVVRYVELNPLRAGLVQHALEYRWSSARGNAGALVDPLLCAKRPFPGWVGDWPAWLESGLTDEELLKIRKNTRRGAPTGSDEFLRKMEERLGRRLRSLPRGPRPRPSLSREDG